MEMQKPTLTRDMLKGLGSKEAKMRAVYELSENKVPVDPELFEEAATYFRKKDPRSAAQMYYRVGNEQIAAEIHEEMSLDFEKKGDLNEAESYARNDRREKLRMKIIKENAAKGQFWDAAYSAKEWGLYELAIENFIKHDLGQDYVEGVSKAAEVASRNEDSYALWKYFAGLCKATGREDIIRAAAIDLKKNEELGLALELYQVLDDQREVIDIAQDLGKIDLALSAILKKGDYSWAERYAKKNHRSDKLPEIYELALSHYKESKDYWKAAGFAESLGRFTEAVELYEKDEYWSSAAEVAEKNGLPEACKINLERLLTEYNKKGSYGTALNIAKKLGIGGEELLNYQKKALDEYEKEFNLSEASKIATELGLDKKVQAYSMLLFFDQR